VNRDGLERTLSGVVLAAIVVALWWTWDGDWKPLASGVAIGVVMVYRQYRRERRERHFANPS